VLFINNHVEIFQHNTNDRPIIKVIILQELESVIEMYTIHSLSFYKKVGLPKNIDEKGLVSLLWKIKGKYSIKYHQFDKIVYKNNSILYDIPSFRKEIPQGFSLFCDEYELALITEYQSRKAEKSKRNIINELLNEINMIPMPKEEHFQCQICSCKFSNYFEHINSHQHQTNIQKFQPNINRIMQALTRVRKNNIMNNKTKFQLNCINFTLSQGNSLTANSSENTGMTCPNKDPSQQTCIGTLSTNTNTVQEYSMLKECLEDNNKYNKLKDKIKYFEKRKYNIFAVDLKKGYDHDPTKRKLSKEMDPFFMQKVKKMLNSLKFEIRLKEKGIKTNENNI
jgi:hypothetical protein